jgi:cystathionine gamma-synthase
VLHDPAHPPSGAASTPIIHSATFTARTTAGVLEQMNLRAAGAFYQRDGHPTLHAVEQKLAGLEEAPSALLFTSGMAATTAAFFGHLRAGDHIVTLRQAYGGTLELLRWASERVGWVATAVDARAPETWDAAFRPATRIFHVESPTNPTLCVVDLRHAADLAHRHGALLTVDNTFASPLGQHPLEHGADLVIYSATKSIGGHSDLLAGAVLGSSEVLDPVWTMRHIFGAVPDPSTAWLIERSLKTLALRVAAANANALELARRLERHPAVGRVLYPGLPEHPGHDLAARQMALGFGPVVSIELPDDARARAFNDTLELFATGPSLGGVESLTNQPSLLSHRKLTREERAAAGISDGLVRLSVGIEDVEDLWADLDRALTRSGVPTA